VSRLLDLALGVGQVASTVRFVVCDRLLSPIGEVHPEKTVSIANDTAGNIMRTLRNLTLLQNEVRSINMFADRLVPVWVLEDGSGVGSWGGWPLGAFLFSSRIRRPGSIHSVHEVTLMDQGFQLDQETSRSFGIPLYGNIFHRIVSLVEQAGLIRYNVEESSQLIGGVPIAWPIGTRWSEILRQLCLLGGYERPFFDNEGVLQVRRPEPLSEDTQHTYDLADVSRVKRDSLSDSDNLLDAPNVYIVLNNGAGNNEIMARVEIDPSLPHSVANVGYERPRIVRMQGLADTAHARRVAEALADRDPGQLRTVSFASPPDPRHDTFDSVRFDGALYRETAWSLDCTPGGDHQHSLVVKVQDDEETA
jgi:hypothetical protein